MQMMKIENDCVHCGLPCMGDSCKYMNVPHYYCDECGDECYEDEMYELEDQELCLYCLKEKTKIRR